MLKRRAIVFEGRQVRVGRPHFLSLGRFSRKEGEACLMTMFSEENTYIGKPRKIDFFRHPNGIG